MRLTLLVPTYDRANLLARQLAALSRRPDDCCVQVLDSSPEAAAAANAAAAEASGAGYRRFPQDMPVFAKFAAGIAAVETPYCVLVADDDFFSLGALGPILDFLDSAPDHAAAHGLYCDFYTARGQVAVRRICYAGAAVDAASPTRRVADLLSGYEALTYAVHRTEAAAEAFAAAAGQQSVHGQELLGGTVAAALGKVARLPVVSHGRRLGSTLGYTKANPVEWLVIEPQGLFRAYLPYREALLGVLRRAEAEAQGVLSEAELARQIDLAHLAYLGRYLDSEALLEAARRTDGEMPPQELAEAAWEALATVRGPRWLRPLRGGNPVFAGLRRLWRRRELRFLLQAAAACGGTEVQATAGPVRFHPDFLQAAAALAPDLVAAPSLQALAEELAVLELAKGA